MCVAISSSNGSLISIIIPTGERIAFKYGAFGRRIVRSYGSREFLYTVDKNVPLHR